MKVSKKYYYHKLGYDFADYLDWRPQLRGNSKKKQSNCVSKNARNMMKNETRKDILEYNMQS